jgi:dihydrofolate reductase
VSASLSDLTIRTPADGGKRPCADGGPTSHRLRASQQSKPASKEAKMRKLIVSTYTTLDGKVDELQDWALPYDDDGVAAYHDDLLANSDGLLLGRKTYEIFAAIWPPRAGKLPYVDKINSMPKYVASTTLRDLEWENSHLIEGDAAQGVAKLKQQAGQDLVVYGGQDFMDSLLEHDLVDEYRILVAPVLLGRGRCLLKDGARRVNLELVDTTVIPPGMAVLTYQPVR